MSINISHNQSNFHFNFNSSAACLDLDQACLEIFYKKLLHQSKWDLPHSFQAHHSFDGSFSSTYKLYKINILRDKNVYEGGYLARR